MKSVIIEIAGQSPVQAAVLLYHRRRPRDKNLPVDGIWHRLGGRLNCGDLLFFCPIIKIVGRFDNTAAGGNRRPIFTVLRIVMAALFRRTALTCICRALARRWRSVDSTTRYSSLAFFALALLSIALVCWSHFANHFQPQSNVADVAADDSPIPSDRAPANRRAEPTSVKKAKIDSVGPVADRPAKPATSQTPAEPRSPRNDLQAALDFLAAANAPSETRPAPEQVKISPTDPSEPAGKPTLSSPASASAVVDEQKVDEFAGGGGLEGREGETKYQLVQRGGATPRSEEAVSRGLKWLVAHQRENGGWRFDHHETPCYDRCSHPGTVASTTGSTALALLCFYGAGYTHKNESEYKEVVNKGLYYLGSRMLVTPDGGDLQEGSMYSQGLAAIALCEAYAMSGDENLKPFAQSAIDFIVYSQDKTGGGWRYFPGQPGDTSSFGWQLMALKSAKLAGLKVPPNVIYMSTRFLDSVETDAGAGYGYQTKKREATTTAVGLLCRMYTGWTRQHDGIKGGIKFLVKEGPSKTNLYFNYYATQCLHNWDGGEWYDWNKAMRDYLIATQATQGHEAGSWWFDDEKTKAGGRLYNTCMAIMTLEVYYRYMPLNNFKALEGK